MFWRRAAGLVAAAHRLEQGVGRHRSARRLWQHHQLGRLRRDRRLGTAAMSDDLVRVRSKVEARVEAWVPVQDAGQGQCDDAWHLGSVSDPALWRGGRMSPTDRPITQVTIPSILPQAQNYHTVSIRVTVGVELRVSRGRRRPLRWEVG